MITRSEKLRLGIFLVASGSILMFAIIVLAGISFMESRDFYKVRFDESVSGLEVGAQVKYNGVRIGQVVDIQIDEDNIDRVVTSLALRKGTPVKTDTKAVLVAMGITGLKFIEFTGGSSAAKNVEPGAFIKAGRSVIGTLEGKAQDIAVKIELALNKINTILTDKNIENIDEILLNVKDISGNVNELLDKNNEKINNIITNLDRTSVDLKKGMASANRSARKLEGIISSSKPKVNKIIDNVNATTKSFKKVAEDLSKTDEILKEVEVALKEFNAQLKAANVKEIAESARSAIEEANSTLKSIRRVVDASRENLYKSSKSLKKSLRYFEEFSEEIRDNPSLLMSSEPPEDIMSSE